MHPLHHFPFVELLEFSQQGVETRPLSKHTKADINTIDHTALTAGRKRTGFQQRLNEVLTLLVTPLAVFVLGFRCSGHALMLELHTIT